VGDATFTLRTVMTAVSGLSSGVVTVEAGAAHSCALLNDASVRCWGWNINFQQLGDGTSVDRNTPLTPQGLSASTTFLGCGYGSTLVIQSGAVKTLGQNERGELGLGDQVQRSAPTLGWDSGATGQSEIRAGRYFSCAQRVEDGGVRCVGSDLNGRLGNGQPNDGSTSIGFVNVDFGEATGAPSDAGSTATLASVFWLAGLAHVLLV
jgi:alpha-tubulin suppressor-like RCC1 family protein